MAVSVALSDSLVKDAKIHAVAMTRSASKQIEHWAKIGKIAEENPDLSFQFLKDILISREQVKAKETSEYQFG